MIMRNMREKKQAIVSTTATGCVEGDMLGQILIWVERKNRPYPHKIHSKKLKGYTFLSRSEVAKLIQSGTQTAPLRRICALPGKGWSKLRGYISSLRKKKVNR